MRLIKSKNLKMFALLVLIAVATIGYSLAGTPNSHNSYKLYLDGKELDSSWVGEMSNNVYISADLVKKFGGKVETDEWITTATITEKNGVVTEFSSASNMVERSGEKISLHTRNINGVHVPSGIKTFGMDEHFMIPAESFEQLFGYPVSIESSNNTITINIGEKVGSNPTTNPNKPIKSTIKEDPRYPFPKGYTPKEITSQWTNNKNVNLENIAKDLGELARYQKEAGATVSNVDGKFYTGGEDILVISHDELNMIPHDATIRIKNWPSGHYEPDNAIPYATKEILKFYLGEKDGEWATNMIGESFKKDMSDTFNKQIKVGNRYIEFRSNVILIGKPNEKYDKYWRNKIK